MNTSQNNKQLPETYKKGKLVFGNQFQVDNQYSRTDFSELYELTPLALNGKFILKIIHYNKQLFPVENANIQKRLNRIKKTNNKHIAPIVEYSFDGAANTLNIHTIEPLYSQTLSSKIKMSYNGDVFCNSFLSPAETKKYFMQLCEAVSSLHENNITHGNLKPQNIYFEKQSIKLGNFELIPFHKTVSFLDISSNILNTLFWKAPEQLNSDNPKISISADIWALGVILYQLVRGQHPFDGNPIQTVTSIADAENNHKRIENIPQSIVDIVSKCLEKNPKNRYSSVRSLLNDIQDNSFTKKCSSGHENVFHATVCKKCSAGFGKKVELSLEDDEFEFDFDFSDTTEDAVIENWFSHSSVRKELTAGDEDIIDITVKPNFHPDIESNQYKSKDLIIKFQSFDKIISVPLLLPPSFAITPEKQNLTPENSEIVFNLQLIESKAIIERINVEIKECDNAVENVTYHETMGKPISGSSNLYPINVRFNLLKLKDDEEYSVVFYLFLKNRIDPYKIDKVKISTTNPPKLIVMPQQKPIEIDIVRSDEKIEKSFKVQLSGNGELRINHIKQSQRNEKIENLSQILSFDNNKFPITLLSDSKPNEEIKLHIFPKYISKNKSKLNINLIIAYQINDDGDWEPNETTKELIIDIDVIKNNGILLAVDFGTTNTCCMAYTDSDTKETQLDLYGKPDKVIPSFIEYYSHDKGGVDIGDPPKAASKEGRINTFHSFKRYIANPKKIYKVYPPEGDVLKYIANDLTTNFLECLIKKAEASLRYRFKEYVFTHPSKISLPKLRQFRTIIETNFHNYKLIDEATAGALYTIYQREGKYRLLVYDFGGGTIDITYLFVNNDASYDLISVHVFHIDGMPDFGGDDITEAIVNIFLEKYKKETSIEIRDPTDAPDDEYYEKEERDNWQILWLYLDRAKVEQIFGNNKMFKGVVPIKIKDRTTNKWVKSTTEIMITPDEVYHLIYERISDSVQIVLDIFQKENEYHEKSLENEYAFKEYRGTPKYILLSGRSSSIPIVKEMFEAYKVGNRPEWNDVSKKLIYKNEPGAANLQYFGKDEHDQGLIFSDKLKACVASGALLYIKSPLRDIKASGFDNINWYRIGTVEGAPGLGFTFIEWIPKGKKFTPKSEYIDKKHKDFLQYAIADVEYRYRFTGDGKLLFPIAVCEHFGIGTTVSDSNCQQIASFTIVRPQKHTKTRMLGRLRIEITEEHIIKIEATIEGEKVNATNLMGE